MNRCTVFTVWQGLCTISGKEQLYTYLPTLGATSSIFHRRVRQGTYTIRGKPAVPAQDTWFCLNRLHSAMRSIHNSRKTQLYTYKVCKKTAFVFPRIVILHTILGKNSHTLTKASLHLVTYNDSAHILKKNQPYTYLTYHSRPVILMQPKI